MSQQIIVRPLGIITQPNKLGSIPEGALAQADRAYMRDPGTIEAALPWQAAGQTTSAGPSYLYSASSAFAIWLINASAWSYVWLDIASGSFLGPGTALLRDQHFKQYSVSSAGRWSAFTQRGRTLLSCTRGALTWDYDSPTTGQYTPRSAGLDPPLLAYSAVFVGDTGTYGALLPNTACHCVAVVRRKMADGYELVSAPSAATHAYNIQADPGKITHGVRWNGGDYLAGDVVEIYRTRAQTYAVAGSTNTGADFYLSVSVTIASNGTSGLTITDTVPDSQLGVALYTNQGIEGAAAGYLPPPTAKCSASFRSYAFYANVTEPPVFQFRPAVFWGDLGGIGFSPAPSFTRQNGLGQRAVTGATTSGGNTLTGVAAADMVGVVVGQRSDNVGFSGSPAVVTAVTSSTITFDKTFTATSASNTFSLYDVIEICGAVVRATSYSAFVVGISDAALAGSFPVSLRIYLQGIGRIYPNKDLSNAAIGQRVDTIPADWITIATRLWPGTGVPLTVRATNGASYVPPLPKLELNETALSISEKERLNLVLWSEEDQPEHVPAPNYFPVGRGEIYQIYSTRDALWVFASDGLWRVSGTGGTVGDSDWRADPVDSTLILAGPRAGCVLRDVVYAYTNRGFVAVDSSGSVTELSGQRLADLLPGQPWATPTWSKTTAIYAVADEENDEVRLHVPPVSSETEIGRVWIYNAKTDAFTRDIAVYPSVAGATTVHMEYGRAAGTLLAATENSASLQGLIINGLSANAAQMDLRYQPLVASSPFSMRHWQNVEVAYETAVATNLSCSVNAYGAIGTRALTGTDPSEYARTAFSVPRNAPSTANQFQVALSTSAAAAPGRIRLQGFAVSYVDFTDQRKKR